MQEDSRACPHNGSCSAVRLDAGAIRVKTLEASGQILRVRFWKVTPIRASRWAISHSLPRSEPRRVDANNIDQDPATLP